MASYTPFEIDSPKQVSSSVIKDATAWQDASLLIPHEAIRVMLDRFEAGIMIDTLDKALAFDKLWREWIHDFIHHHHDIEEETYMPWINKRVPSPAGLVIEHDHEALLAEMDTISKLAAEQSLAAGAKLPEMLRTFAANMSAHLANEETYVPQMLRDAGYTHEEEGAMIGEIMQSLEPKAFATMMPLIFYAMDKAGGYGPLTGAVFFGTLPPPVQEAYAGWKATFERDFLDVLASLATPQSTRETAPVLDGFNTPRIDTACVAYQADPKYLPDKAHLWKTAEAQDGWVHAHNAIRFEIGELKRVIEALAMQPLAEWQVAAVQAWWAGHETHVHEHHSNEDDVFNPVVRTRVIYPEKLEADHVELVAAMDAVGAHVRALAPGTSLAALQPLWATYEALMLPHLFEEEQVGLPLVRAYFTPAEVEKVVASFMKNGDPVALGSFVHVLGHKKDAQAFMRENGIPTFVWHVPGSGFKALRALYREKMQSHIDSLLAGEPVVSLSKKQAKENAAKAAKAHSSMIARQSALSPSKRANVLSPRFVTN